MNQYNLIGWTKYNTYYYGAELKNNTWKGKNNPGYGKIWITNNLHNIRIYKQDLEKFILLGYKKGMFKSKETKINMSIASLKRQRNKHGVFI